MTATLKDLIGAAKTAAQNQAAAQAATKSTAAQIAAQRGSAGRTAAVPAGGQDAGTP